MDPNEEVAYSHGLDAVMQAFQARPASTLKYRADTLLLMVIPKSLHPDIPFWNEPEDFMMRLLPMFQHYGAVHTNQLLAVDRDQRLTSYAGKFRLEFKTHSSTYLTTFHFGSLQASLTLTLTKRSWNCYLTSTNRTCWDAGERSTTSTRRRSGTC